ncbi:MAG: serine hydrolase [Chloroflexota bacterium]
MSRLILVLVAAAVLIALVALGAGAFLPTLPDSAAAPAATTVLVPGTTVVSATTLAATSTPPPAATPTPSPTQAPTVEPTPAAAATATPVAATARVEEWGRLVEQHLGDLTGEFGVIVKDLKTGETFTLNPSRPFPSASLYKLGLLYEVLKQDKEGNLSLTTKMDITSRHMAEAESDEKLVEGMTVTIDRSLWFLITLSSNSAAAALHEYVDWADMNESMRSIGLVNTRMPDGKQASYGDWRDTLGSTTPQEMLRYFEMVYRQEMLDAEASEKMMYLLRNQQVDDRLSVKLPKGVVMAHKTGNLSGVINDVGIIFGPKTDLYVGVMSQGADYESTTNALQGLGRALFDAANR